MTSPGWVGAWWIGFLASFATCFTLAFPLFTYPRILPGRVVPVICLWQSIHRYCSNFEVMPEIFGKYVAVNKAVDLEF